MPHTPRADDVDRAVRPFADVLKELSKGATEAELSETLQQLVDACLDTGKAGSVTLTVKIAPMKGDRRAVSVSDSIKVSLPEADRDPSMFFADQDNNLRRNDPNQLEFPSLTEVPAPPGVNATTGEVITPAPLTATENPA